MDPRSERWGRFWLGWSMVTHAAGAVVLSGAAAIGLAVQGSTGAAALFAVVALVLLTLFVTVLVLHRRLR